MTVVLDNDTDERLDRTLGEEQLHVAITAMSLAFRQEVSLERKSSHADGSIIE